jgi:hypothetical protein
MGRVSVKLEPEDLPIKKISGLSGEKQNDIVLLQKTISFLFISLHESSFFKLLITFKRRMSMKKFFITTIVLALIQFAKAQTDSAKENVLDEVVVTATKSPKKLSETGKVIKVITQEQI